jgi:L-lysine exporter family protein LysE/ArgO
VTGFGIAFLVWYGVAAARRAMRPSTLIAGNGGRVSLKAAMLACLTLTYLNPHVYLDTVILVGSLAAPYSGMERIAYAAGAMSASFVWFFALAYGARLLTPLFAKPASWRILDTLIALVMFAIAGRLALWLARAI